MRDANAATARTVRNEMEAPPDPSQPLGVGRNHAFGSPSELVVDRLCQHERADEDRGSEEANEARSAALAEREADRGSEAEDQQRRLERVDPSKRVAKAAWKLGRSASRHAGMRSHAIITTPPANSPPPSRFRDCFAILEVSDLQRSLPFYRGLIGFDLTYSFPSEEEPPWARRRRRAGRERFDGDLGVHR
jgi:hypothetical protein